MAVEVKHYWKSGSPPWPIFGDYLEFHISVMVDTRVIETSPRFIYEQPQSFFELCEDYIRKFLSCHLYTPFDLHQVDDEIKFFIQEKFSIEDDDSIVIAPESLPQEFCLFISIGSEEYVKEKIKKKGCAICLEDYGEDDIAWMFSCVHAFHKKCIAKWLRKGDSCPLCRDPLEKKCMRKKKKDDRYTPEQRIHRYWNRRQVTLLNDFFIFL